MRYLFVHGINVRGDESEKTREKIQSELRKNLSSTTISVAACTWGNDLGASLGFGGKSIPTYETARGIGVLGESDQERLLWADLYEDPLVELASLTSSTKDVDEMRPPTHVQPEADIVGTVRQLVTNARVQKQVEALGWGSYFPEAIQTVADSDELLSISIKFDSALAVSRPLARAVFAALNDRAESAGEPAMGGEGRDILLAEIETALGGTHRGLVSWYANRYAKRKRGALMDRITPIMGDIILYQGRGGEIRQRIENMIDESDEPVCVFAHSLGGIACVDTLNMVSRLRRKVSYLFTVGSQSGYFHEVNAMVGLPRGAVMPDDFPKWINFYDKADMLSFLAEPIFPGRVRDVEVNSREPFPSSHSAYWNASVLWSFVASVLTQPE